MVLSFAEDSAAGLRQVFVPMVLLASSVGLLFGARSRLSLALKIIVAAKLLFAASILYHVMWSFAFFCVAASIIGLFCMRLRDERGMKYTVLLEMISMLGSLGLLRGFGLSVNLVDAVSRTLWGELCNDYYSWHDDAPIVLRTTCTEGKFVAWIRFCAAIVIALNSWTALLFALEWQHLINEKTALGRLDVQMRKLDAQRRAESPTLGASLGDDDRNNSTRPPLRFRPSSARRAAADNSSSSSSSDNSSNNSNSKSGSESASNSALSRQSSSRQSSARSSRSGVADASSSSSSSSSSSYSSSEMSESRRDEADGSVSDDARSERSGHSSSSESQSS